MAPRTADAGTGSGGLGRVQATTASVDSKDLLISQLQARVRELEGRLATELAENRRLQKMATRFADMAMNAASQLDNTVAWDVVA